MIYLFEELKQNLAKWEIPPAVPGGFFVGEGHKTLSIDH